jgi:hypothetical protein
MINGSSGIVCASSGSAALTADQLSLTVTAVGTLHDNGSALILP